MSYETTGRYNEYYVRTDDVDGLKSRLGALAAVNAELPIEITGSQDGGVTNQEVVFRVGEVNGESTFISRGTVTPLGTEAVIRSMKTDSGNEYLVMDVDLGVFDDPDRP